MDSSSTSEASIPSAAATAFALATESSIPFVPVAAFACPAFTSTALARALFAIVSLQYSTGAAATIFFVKTPAESAGSSATTSAQSALVPVARRPALSAAALNPIGAHTPPSIGVHDASFGRSSEMGASGSWNSAAA